MTIFSIAATSSFARIFFDEKGGRERGEMGALGKCRRGVKERIEIIRNATQKRHKKRQER